MNGYVPKVGDKVRATFGENVLIGTVDPGPEPYMRIAVSPEDYVVTIIPDRWQFEQVVSVPTKFGAVIRRADGELFQKTWAGTRQYEWLPNANAFSVDDSEATRGGFTVLFEGVDE